MEHGYWPDTQIEKAIKKSKKTILITSVFLFILFSSAIVGSIFYFGGKESTVLDKKLYVISEKVDSISETQNSMMTSLGLINEKLNQTIDNNKVVISGIGSVSNKSNVNNKMDTIVIYIKK